MPQVHNRSAHQGLWVAVFVTGLVALAVVIWSANGILAKDSRDGVASVGSAAGEENDAKNTLPTPVAIASSESFSNSTAPAATNLSGRYDVNVRSAFTLAQASTVVTSSGGKVLFTLSYLNTIVAQLTPAQ